MDEMDEVVICKHCDRPELYGRMMWLNGRCECRKCYKPHWEEINHSTYIWSDLDVTPRESKLISEAVLKMQINSK